MIIKPSAEATNPDPEPLGVFIVTTDFFAFSIIFWGLSSQEKAKRHKRKQTTLKNLWVVIFSSLKLSNPAIKITPVKRKFK